VAVTELLNAPPAFKTAGVPPMEMPEPDWDWLDLRKALAPWLGVGFASGCNLPVGTFITSDRLIQYQPHKARPSEAGG